MIAIPKELQQAVQESEDNLVRLIDPDTNTEYVVLPAKKFTEIQTAFYDDSPLTPEERRALLIQAGLRAGWNDPDMDVYNELDPRRDDDNSTR